MGSRNPAKAALVSLREAFDMVGREQFGEHWDGSEAKAIRLGQRTKSDRAAWERGRAAEKAMRAWLESGSLSLVYTDGQGRRVRYPEHISPWVTAVHPDPHDAIGGMVELISGDIHPAFADVSRLRKLVSGLSLESGRRGRKAGFAMFRAAVEEFFSSHRLDAPNQEVRAFIIERRLDDEEWPGKSQQNAIILEIRTALNDKRLIAGRSPVGPL